MSLKKSTQIRLRIFTHITAIDHEMRQRFFNFIPPMSLIYCCVSEILGCHNFPLQCVKTRVPPSIVKRAFWAL